MLLQELTCDCWQDLQMSLWTLTTLLPTLLGLAWLLPLASFVLIVFFGKRMGHGGKAGRIPGHGRPSLSGFVLSLAAVDPLAQRPSAWRLRTASRPVPSAAIGTRWAEFGSLAA